MLNSSHMKFDVDADAVLCNILSGEVYYATAAKGNLKKREMYNKMRIINSSSSIPKLIKRHPEVFRDKRLIKKGGADFFSESLPIFSLEGDNFKKLESRLQFNGLTHDEISNMDKFFKDFDDLKKEPDIQRIIEATEGYKDSIESAWNVCESKVMSYIKSILGEYKPENNASVKTYIVYPNFNTYRCSQTEKGNINFYFGKRDKDVYKIIANLTHQAVHQPMLPYQTSMTKKDKERFHCFIKFLTDKEIYSYLSGKSYLDIITEKENPNLMAKVYPFWLGYRYRNADKEGLNPEEEIQKAINRDKKAFEALPENSPKRVFFSQYNFDKYDPKKIAHFFKDKRAITPYEFARLPFDNVEMLYRNIEPEYKGR